MAVFNSYVTTYQRVSNGIFVVAYVSSFAGEHQTPINWVKIVHGSSGVIKTTWQGEITSFFYNTYSITKDGSILIGTFGGNEHRQLLTGCFVGYFCYELSLECQPLIGHDLLGRYHFSNNSSWSDTQMVASHQLGDSESSWKGGHQKLRLFSGLVFFSLFL